MKTTLILTVLLLEPLGFTADADWPRIELKAGETKTVTVTADGKLK